MSNERSVTQLANAIREAIIFGRYRPRERLVEEEITERYSTTRHMLRMAFAELDHMGLVERRPNKGVVVRDFSIQELEELYEFRALLQREAALRIPVPADPDLVSDLRKINANYLAASKSGDKEEASRLNTTFHETMFDACRNRFLATAISQAWMQTTPIHWYALGDTDHLRRSHADHKSMIDALESGERELLAELCRKHIYPALEAYRRVHAVYFNGPD
ncbi:MAG: GntR family transcriptional regulator [Mesorhizobium sp.]